HASNEIGDGRLAPLLANAQSGGITGSPCPSGPSSSRKPRQASSRTTHRTEEKEKQVVEKVPAI
ncbi:hypothetical protein, partial [Xanthomonas campestris]|uniref:hypothetical protein n=1 Tax=Xanthomonas campestris TaxID=339 RepID=UPI0024286479